MKWVTRERPKIDRIACPWLIRRFVEADAEFLYVPTEKVFEVAAATGAVPYDIPGAEPFTHVGELCSFDAFLAHYNLTDPALQRLAIIVRGADTARLDLAPQAAGCSPSRSGCPRNSRTTTQCWTTPWWFTTRSTPGARATSMRRTTGRQDRPRHDAKSAVNNVST